MLSGAQVLRLRRIEEDVSAIRFHLEVQSAAANLKTPERPMNDFARECDAHLVRNPEADPRCEFCRQVPS